ncbi:MAG: hypothetical protein AAF378_23530 [Cyanobacteria bacterium P01_A01_bin.84]
MKRRQDKFYTRHQILAAEVRNETHPIPIQPTNLKRVYIRWRERLISEFGFKRGRSIIKCDVSSFNLWNDSNTEQLRFIEIVKTIKGGEYTNIIVGGEYKVGRPISQIRISIEWREALTKAGKKFFTQMDFQEQRQLIS